MPSSTKVAGVWRNITRQFVKVAGTWRPVHTTWVNVAGVWKSTWNAMTFKQGYMEGGVSFVTKQATYVDIYAESLALEYSGEATMVTTQAIDLTGVTNLQVDWERTEGGAQAYLIASTNQMGNTNTYNARIGTGAGGRFTSTLNVSALSGSFYVRASVYSTIDSDGWARFRVYRVFIDGSEVWNASNAGSWA